MRELKKWLVRQANSNKRGPLKPLIAFSASAWATLKSKQITRVGIDEDGHWYRVRGEGRLYSPSYPRSEAAIYSEVDDIWCYYRRIGEGSVVIDVGAGGGEHAIVVSELVGPKGRVYALEAHPDTFKCLVKTVISCGLENVVPLNVAIGDKDGETVIESGDFHLRNRTGVDSGEPVPMLTLESLLNEIDEPQPDFVKMNIEGAERQAIKGAGAALETVRHWVVSCHDFIAHRPGHQDCATLADVITALESADCKLLELRAYDPRPNVRYHVYADGPAAA